MILCELFAKGFLLGADHSLGLGPIADEAKENGLALKRRGFDAQRTGGTGPDASPGSTRVGTSQASSMQAAVGWNFDGSRAAALKRTFQSYGAADCRMVASPLVTFCGAIAWK